MSRINLLCSITALALAAIAGPAPAQTNNDATTGAQTRVQVKMDRDEFLKTHRWDSTTDVWSLKSGVEPPVGVKSRAEVIAMRDEYLRNNLWDRSRGEWQPVKGGPRTMSSLSRAQVVAETRQFEATHRWDETDGLWVDQPKRTKMQ